MGESKSYRFLMGLPSYQRLLLAPYFFLKTSVCYPFLRWHSL